MIFSRTIKTIKSDRSQYRAKKQEEKIVESEESGEEIQGQAPTIRKNIHKVLVVGGGERKRSPVEIHKHSVVKVNDNWQHDKYRGPVKPTKVYGIFLRNLHPKVAASDITRLIEENDLLGIKVLRPQQLGISNRTGELNFATIESAIKTIETLNDRQLFGLKIKAMAQFESPNQETNIKIVKREREEKSSAGGLRMYQHESIFDRIQMKKQ